MMPRKHIGVTSSAENNLTSRGVSIGTGGARGHVESTRTRVGSFSVGLG